MNHCQKKCLGFDGNHGGCCTVGDRDFIIGPIHDSHEFLERLKQKYPGTELNWDDVFIGYEEGSKLFPNKSHWQNPSNYPCLRVNKDTNVLPCVFYNTAIKCCTVYDIRPQTCKSFFCEYLRNML